MAVPAWRGHQRHRTIGGNAVRRQHSGRVGVTNPVDASDGTGGGRGFAETERQAPQDQRGQSWSRPVAQSDRQGQEQALAVLAIQPASTACFAPIVSAPAACGEAAQQQGDVLPADGQARQHRAVAEVEVYAAGRNGHRQAGRQTTEKSKKYHGNDMPAHAVFRSLAACRVHAGAACCGAALQCKAIARRRPRTLYRPPLRSSG